MAGVGGADKAEKKNLTFFRRLYRMKGVVTGRSVRRFRRLNGYLPWSFAECYMFICMEGVSRG